MNPDIAHLRQRINAYPSQIWYSIATLMSIVAVAHAASCLHAKFAQRKLRKNDQESNSPKIPSTLHPRRLPLAILNAYRVAAFRWTVDIKMGQKFTLNLAEVFFTTVYIIAIFTWTFINSKFSFVFSVWINNIIVHSDISFRQETRLLLLVEPRWRYCR